VTIWVSGKRIECGSILAESLAQRWPFPDFNGAREANSGAI